MGNRLVGAREDGSPYTALGSPPIKVGSAVSIRASYLAWNRLAYDFVSTRNAGPATIPATLSAMWYLDDSVDREAGGVSEISEVHGDSADLLTGKKADTAQRLGDGSRSIPPGRGPVESPDRIRTPRIGHEKFERSCEPHSESERNSFAENAEIASRLHQFAGVAVHWFDEYKERMQSDMDGLLR